MGDNMDACPYWAGVRCSTINGDMCNPEDCNHRRRYEETAAHPETPKSPMHLLDLEFAAAMCDNLQEGIRGERVANGWKGMEWSKELHDKYVGAILRHLLAYQVTRDPRQLAAIACNANIIWHHERKND